MIIETERLILRPFTEDDSEEVYEYLKEPAVNCFASMKLNSVDEAKEEMKKRISETEYYFAITLKDSNKVIGEIDAYPETGEPHADENSVRDTFSPCWMLNADYQGKGYAFEAAHAFLIISSVKKVQGVFTPMLRIIIYPVSICVKSSVCAERAYSWNLYHSSITPMELRTMKILISMLF